MKYQSSILNGMSQKLRKLLSVLLVIPSVFKGRLGILYEVNARLAYCCCCHVYAQRITGLLFSLSFVLSSSVCLSVSFLSASVSLPLTVSLSLAFSLFPLSLCPPPPPHSVSFFCSNIQGLQIKPQLLILVDLTLNGGSSTKSSSRSYPSTSRLATSSKRQTVTTTQTVDIRVQNPLPVVASNANGSSSAGVSFFPLATSRDPLNIMAAADPTATGGSSRHITSSDFSRQQVRFTVYESLVG